MYILLFIIGIFIFFLIFFSLQFYFQVESTTENRSIVTPDADVTKPKFAINNVNNKIYITANEGNFLSDDEILLKKNVRFKSNDFIIETNNVLFNRKSQNATSNVSSIFKSKKTTISSEGFDIYDNGNKIKFNGKAKLIVK